MNIDDLNLIFDVRLGPGPELRAAANELRLRTIENMGPKRAMYACCTTDQGKNPRTGKVPTRCPAHGGTMTQWVTILGDQLVIRPVRDAS